MNWYVVQVFSGQEDSVEKRILALAETPELRGHVGQVLVPRQEVVSLSGGKRKTTLKKMVPGYIYIELELGDVQQAAIAAVPGVMGFLGSGNRPAPLSQQEVNGILGIESETSGVSGAVLDIPYEVGDLVRIKSGPFMNFDGKVEEVQPEKGKLKVMVSVFGRFTPVDLGFDHVEELS